MSSETRTMIVVLMVCGFLLVGCIGVPVAVGALFVYTLQRQAQVAEAQARDQAGQAMQNAQQQLNQIPNFPAAPTIPSIPRTPGQFLTPPPEPTPPLPPAHIPTDAAGLKLPIVLTPPTEINVEDPSQRKYVYQTVKPIRDAIRSNEDLFSQLKASGLDDANLNQILTDVKKQQESGFDRLCEQFKITRRQLDEILAEGDKARW